jgi:hypothetical protein
MQTLLAGLLALVWGCFGIASTAHAEAADFTGSWTLDLRSAAQRLQGAACGVAVFDLRQSSLCIVGSHACATPGCGRLNEGGEGTVQGPVQGDSAELEVTSGRHGAVVRGTASLRRGQLHGVTLLEVKAGEPSTDSPLILQEGILPRETAEAAK